MNAYIIVEGSETEMIVYPQWLNILVPHLTRIDDARLVSINNYYLLSSHGIPSINGHVSNAVEDINYINKHNLHKYDYLLVCLDTEDEDYNYILGRINDKLKTDNRTPNDFQIVVFEQKVCMETWFLGNNKVFKNNPQDQELLNYINFYNVSKEDPELMDNGDKEWCDNKAHFHLRYLKAMFRERKMRYKKNQPNEVCKKSYLEELVTRYRTTNHLPSFGRWYDFVVNNL